MTDNLPAPDYDIDGLSPQLIGQLYERYLTSALTVKEVALEAGIPVAKLAKFAERKKWPARKQAIELEEMMKAESQYRSWLLENKLSTAKDQHAVSALLIEKLKEVLEDVSADDKTADSKLRRIADALKSASDVGARAVGLSDTPMSDFMKKQQDAQSRTPIVIVGAGAISKGSLDARVIDVEAEEIPE